MEIFGFKITELLILKLLKFVAVGFGGMLIDFSVTYLLKEKANVKKYTANACGFLVAASFNYIINRVWTFQSNNPHMLIEYANFLIISMFGLLINSLVLKFLVTRFKYNFYFSKLIAIFVTTFWNFIANLLFTFQP
jgi:putative flippase GtrA